MTGWQRAFEDAILLPKGRQLVTLKDAAGYIMKLPKAEQNLPEWQAATEALIMAAESRSVDACSGWGAASVKPECGALVQSRSKRNELGKAEIKEGCMTDQQILIDAIERAGVIIAKYIDPRITVDPERTINGLIAVLDTQEVAGAIKRLKAGFGLKVVK